MIKSNQVESTKKIIKEFLLYLDKLDTRLSLCYYDDYGGTFTCGYVKEEKRTVTNLITKFAKDKHNEQT